MCAENGTDIKAKMKEKRFYMFLCLFFLSSSLGVCVAVVDWRLTIRKLAFGRNENANNKCICPHLTLRSTNCNQYRDAHPIHRQLNEYIMTMCKLVVNSFLSSPDLRLVRRGYMAGSSFFLWPEAARVLFMVDFSDLTESFKFACVACIHFLWGGV